MLKNDGNSSEIQNNSSEMHLNNIFNLSFKEGTIPANSEICVDLIFSPLQVASYDLRLIVSAKQKAPRKISTLKQRGLQPSTKCEMKIKARGSYPLLEVIDIRNDTLSVAALW